MAAIERKIYVDYNLQNNKISNVHADLFNVGISRKSINYALQATDNYKVTARTAPTETVRKCGNNYKR